MECTFSQVKGKGLLAKLRSNTVHETHIIVQKYQGALKNVPSETTYFYYLFLFI